ncbi:MAG TPA: hypothetical protein VF627_12385 [Abditibacterium sp.]|jgi:hypothetical protein
MPTTEDTHFQLEHRFYPTYPMKIEWDSWRTKPSGTRASLGFAYNSQIQQLLFERIESVHPDWSHEQHKMMFFKLSYVGDHFEKFARAKIARGDLTAECVEAVRATPIPFDRAECEKYTAISHPDLDEESNIWPSSAERGSNI